MGALKPSAFALALAACAFTQVLPVGAGQNAHVPPPARPTAAMSAKDMQHQGGHVEPQVGVSPVQTRGAKFADGVARWRTDIADAASRYGIPADWIEHVMRAESGGQTVWNGKPITSSAGAMGLMQLMPATWETMRRVLRLGDNPHDPRDNIFAGTAYLRMLYDRFGYPGLFGAYNAGPGRYQAYLGSGRSLPEETRSYLLKLIGATRPPLKNQGAAMVGRYASRSERRPAPPPLFIVSHGGRAGSDDAKTGTDQARTPSKPAATGVFTTSSTTVGERLFVVRNVP